MNDSPMRNASVTGATQRLEVVRGPQPALGHRRHLVRDPADEGVRGPDVDLHGAEVAVVDTDDVRPGVEGTGELAGSMYLDERGQPRLAGLVDQLSQRWPVERRRNQQHRVGAVRARLGHLVRCHEEVLAQHRHVDRRPDRREVLERAVEECRLRQD